MSDTTDRSIAIPIARLSLRLAARLPEGEPNPYTPSVLRRFIREGMRAKQIGRPYYVKEEWFDEFMTAQDAKKADEG